MIFITLLLIALSACTPAVYGQIENENQDHKRIILYPGNVSLVNDFGTTDLEEGSNTFTITGLPGSHLQASSLALLLDAEVHSHEFIDSRYGIQNILMGMEGEEITLVSTGGETISGVLHSFRNGIARIKRDDDATITLTNLHDYYLVTEPGQHLPETGSAATWNVYADEPGAYPYTIRYLTRGLSWQPEYELLLNEEEDRLNFRLFADFQNQTDSDFQNAELVLMVGDVRFQDTPYQPRDEAAAEMRAAPDIIREETFEYYRYVLPEKQNLKRQTTHRFELEQTADFDANRRYRGQLAGFGRPRHETRHFEAGFVFQNTEEYGLGMLLPAGRISVYKAQSGGQELLGQDRINFKAAGEELFVRTGRSSDITWNERQVSLEQGRHGEALEEREITITNRSAERVEVELELNLNPQDTLHDTDMDYEELSARRFLFTVPVSANSEEVRSLKILRDEPRR